MEKQKIDIQLLQIISSDGDIKKLRHFGLSYRQIAELIDSNVESGNLNGEEDHISLTVKGAKLLQARIGELKEREKSKWIGLDIKNKVQQFDKEDVFLPRKNDLSFLK